MPAHKRVGFAVIGLGHISQRAVLPAFRRAKKSRLAALVSGDPRKAERLAREFGALRSYDYDHLDECLRDPQVGAVYIATPPGMHRRFALEAATRGKHVLCEKPLATSVEDCRKMLEACRTNGVRLMTAYRKYFEPASVALKALVSSGRLGKLRVIHTAFTNHLPESATWQVDPERGGGGSLMDLGIYCVSTVRWITGEEPLEASARVWSTDPARFGRVEENIAFQLQFPGGLCMQGSSSFTAAKASFLQVHGEKGWAALDPAYPYTEERRLFGKIGGKWFEKTFAQTEEFHLELDHLADCIQRGRDPQPDGIAGLRDVAVIHAIYESAKLGRAIAIRLPV